MGRGPSRREARVQAGLKAMEPRASEDDGLYALLERARTLLETVFQQVKPETLKIKNANDFYKFAVAFSAFQKAQVELERWNAEKRGYLIEAQEEFRLAVKNELAQHPELCEQFWAVTEAAAAKLQTRQLGSRSE